jgi:Spy/CpxP family protein refolding chaperone
MSDVTGTAGLQKMPRHFSSFIFASGTAVYTVRWKTESFSPVEKELSMRSLPYGFIALVLAGGILTACAAQPPDRRKGPPPGPWNPVHVFPPPVRESLNLTTEQEKQIDDLEKEVRARVNKVLTPEQQKILSEARPLPRGPGGPGRGPGGFDDQPQGGRGGQDRRPPRPDRGPDGFDGPPPPPPGGPGGGRGPAGPREWEQATEQLNLTEAQLKKTDAIFEALNEKMHKQMQDARAEMLSKLKATLSSEQYRRFENRLERD